MYLTDIIKKNTINAKRKLKTPNKSGNPVEFKSGIKILISEIPNVNSVIEDI